MTRLPAVLSLFLLLVFALAANGEDEAAVPAPTLDEELRTVATLTAQGQHAEAQAIATRLIAEHPTSLEAHIAYQDLRLAAGERKNLTKEYAKRATGKEVTADDVYLHARLVTGNRGISLLKKVLKQESMHFHALCSLGSAYTEAGKFKDAERTLNLAARANSESAIPHSCLGWLMQIRGEDEKAEELYRRAIERDPGHAVSHLNLGVLLLDTGRYEESGVALETARKLAPGDPMPLLAQGMLLTALAEVAKDEADEADEEDEAAGDEGDDAEDGKGAEDGAPGSGADDPEDDEGKGAEDGAGEGDGAEGGEEGEGDDRGKDDEDGDDEPEVIDARKLYEQAVEMETNTVASLNMLGSTYIGLGEYKLARQCFSKALGLSKDNVLSLLNLTHLYLAQSLPEKALMWVKQALRSDPKSPEAYYFHGLCLASQGKRKAAEGSYMRASKLDPGNILYLRALGTLYVNLGKFREAVRTFTHAIDLDPDSLDLLLDLAFAYSGAGDARRAATTFEEVLEADADVLTAWLNLGLLYQEKLRRPDLAIEAFREYLDRGGEDKRVEGWLQELL